MFDDMSAFVGSHPAPCADDPDPGLAFPLQSASALLTAAGLTSRVIRKVLDSLAAVGALG